MERHREVAAGLAAGGLGHLYYSPFVLAFSSLDALLTVIMGLGLLQAAAAADGGDAWGVGIGVGTAALASLPSLQGILFGSISAGTVAESLEAVGLLLLAAAVAAWGLAASGRSPDEERLDEGAAVLAFRVACVVSAGSGLLYGASNVLFGELVWLPGNVLVVSGFGLAAWRASVPLFPEDNDAGVVEAEPS